MSMYVYIYINLIFETKDVCTIMTKLCSYICTIMMYNIWIVPTIHTYKISMPHCWPNQISVSLRYFSKGGKVNLSKVCKLSEGIFYLSEGVFQVKELQWSTGFAVNFSRSFRSKAIPWREKNIAEVKIHVQKINQEDVWTNSLNHCA